MTDEITILEIDAGRISVEAPYNPDFVARSHELGGKWSGSDNFWTFDVRTRDAVEAALRQYYNWQPDTPVCDYQLSVPRRNPITGEGGKVTAVCDAVRAGGRIIAWARGRDTGARLGAGVELVSGSITSGGSRARWMTEIAEGTVLIVRDAPVGTNFGSGFVAMPLDGLQVEQQALIVRRDALRAELAEVDDKIAALAKNGGP